MAARHESAAAEVLAAAQAEYDQHGDLSRLPNSRQVAVRLGLSLDQVQKLRAWKAYARWKRELPRPACRVCGRPAHTVSVAMCHTHRERWRRWGMPEPWQEWADACREERLNTCDDCGTLFNGEQGRIKRCGNCHRQMKRERALERWNRLSDAEQEAAKERQLERGRERRERTKTTVTCRICGRTWRDFPHRTLCSDHCRKVFTNRCRREIRRRTKLLELLQQQHELNRRIARGDQD